MSAQGCGQYLFQEQLLAILPQLLLSMWVVRKFRDGFVVGHVLQVTEHHGVLDARAMAKATAGEGHAHARERRDQGGGEQQIDDTESAEHGVLLE